MRPRILPRNHKIRLSGRWRRWQVRLRRRYPRTILRLVMLGFCLVVGPLVIALITATVYVNRIAASNQYSVMQAAHAVRYSRQLVSELGDMERTALLYGILGDKSLLKDYKASSDKFRLAARMLQGLRGKGSQYTQLAHLLSLEEGASQKLKQLSPAYGEGKALESRFRKLHGMAQDVLKHNARLINKQVEHSQKVSRHARHVLLLEALTSLPLAAILGALVIAWIIRPLRSVESSIRHLGSGDFSRPITVHGPQDIEQLGTRLEWLRERLGELENQKQVFLRHVSHELKTPLASVREGVGLLSDRVVGQLNPEQAEIAEILKENSAQLQHRIEDLIDFSFAQGQEAIPNKTRMRLDELVEEVADAHRLVGRNRDISINTRLVPLEIDADSGQIRSILENLLSNALKYSPPGSAISVRLCKNGDFSELEIQDQGPGIAAGDREHVFEPFYQGESSNAGTGPVKGSGLGLSIARQYVKSHEGSIEVLESDEGTHFLVRLPIQDI